MSSLTLSNQQNVLDEGKTAGHIFSRKLHPTDLDQNLLDRSRLLEQLTKHSESDITFVSAPAGFGKSILLSQWYDQLQSQNMPVAWVTLDSLDNDPCRLMAHIESSFLSTMKAQNRSFSQIKSSLDTDLFEERLQHLSKIIDAVDEKCILILDDYRETLSPSFEQVIECFLSLLPKKLHLVISGRLKPLALVGQRWGASKISTIPSKDLLFVDSELSKITNEQATFNSNELLEKTWGWPLIAHFIAESNDNKAPIETLIEKNLSLLKEYISSSLLNNLSETTLNTLIDTSILEEIPINLCNEICAYDEASMIFDQLSAVYPLITHYKTDSQSYEINPIIRKCMRSFFSTRRQSRQNEIFRIVTEWHIKRGRASAALQFALNSHSSDLISDVIEYYGPHTITIKSGATSLKHSLDNIASDEINKSLRLSLARAVILIKDGHFLMAKQKLQKIESKLDWDQVFNDDREGSVQADYIASKYLLALYKNENFNTEFLDKCEVETHKYSASDGLIGFIHALKSLLYQRNSKFSRAQMEAKRSLYYYKAANSNYGIASVYLIEGLCYFAKGQLEAAMLSYKAGKKIIDADFSDDPGLNAIAETLIFEIQYERNEASYDPKELDVTIEKLEKYDGWLDAYVSAYRLRALSALETANYEDAHMSLDRAAILSEERSLSDVEKISFLLRTDIYLHNLDLKSAKAQYKAYLSSDAIFSLEGQAPRMWREADQYYLTSGKLALAEGNPDIALSIANTLVHEANANGRMLSVTRGYILQSHAYDMLKQTTEAKNALRAATILSSGEKYMRVFLEEGLTLLPLLQYLVDSEKQGKKKNKLGLFCSKLISAIRNEANKKQLKNTFTPREMQILQGLSARNTSKEIARELALTESTIKFHLKKIYQKLGVRKRDAAVLEARRQKIVS